MEETRDQYLSRHLLGVSRSFAACIAKLNQPLRDYVGVTYLLCRVLDSIEDGQWSSKKQQDIAFKAFLESLREGALPEALPVYEIPESLTEAEKTLLMDSPRLLKEFIELPEAIRNVILRLATTMCRGMQHFATAEGIRLKTLDEVNRYCYFVAGIVGEALTAIVGHQDNNFVIDSSTLRDAHHFGLFLQKVNLLKDQSEDEKEGRYLVPSKIEVYNSIRKNAEGAWRYIQSLPKSLDSYKIFCSWSFFIGLRTLPKLKTNQSAYKIPRSETLNLFNFIETAVEKKPESLEALYNDLFLKAEFSSSEQATASDKDQDKLWFLENYSQVLNRTLITEDHRKELCFGI